MIRHCYVFLRSSYPRFLSTSSIRPKPQSNFEDFDIDVDDPLPLITEVLQSEGGECNPSVLMKRLRELWVSRSLDPRRIPSSIEFARFNSAIFDIIWENVTRPNGAVQKNASLIRLRPQALEAAKQGRLRRAKHPDPYTWAPIITEELEKAGGYLSLVDVNYKLQEIAVAKGLPLPPLGLSWFALSSHPAYAYIRPVWGQQSSFRRNRKNKERKGDEPNSGEDPAPRVQEASAGNAAMSKIDTARSRNAKESAPSSLAGDDVSTEESIRTIRNADRAGTDPPSNSVGIDKAPQHTSQFQGSHQLPSPAKRTYRKQLGALSYWVIGVSLCRDKTALEKDFDELHAYAKKLYDRDLK